jgi:hypothetical protein
MKARITKKDQSGQAGLCYRNVFPESFFFHHIFGQLSLTNGPLQLCGRGQVGIAIANIVLQPIVSNKLS